MVTPAAGTVSSSVVVDCSARRRKNFSISVVHSTAEANTMQITHCQTVQAGRPEEAVREVKPREEEHQQHRIPAHLD